MTEEDFSALVTRLVALVLIELQKLDINYGSQPPRLH
jgi:hypothetical protein